MIHILSRLIQEYINYIYVLLLILQYDIGRHYEICCKYNIDSLTGVPSSPVLTYKSTLNEILVSWSPVGSDTVCGSVTYNITVMPSHGMIMMINDTVYNITGLYYNTNYTITVYATNDHSSGEPTTVTVKTKSLPPGA